MRLWQATWDLGGSLLIWGEESSRARLAKSQRESAAHISSLDRRSTPLHPFCCSSEELAEDLASLSSSASETQERSVFLPSYEHAPAPSPMLLQSHEGQAGSDLRLRPWRVPVLCLSPLASLHLLTSLPKQNPHGLRLDDSFQFWVEATKLLLDLLARGRYLPAMLRVHQHYASHWFLLSDEPLDHQRIRTLADCMPPVCRAVTQVSGVENPEPASLIESFLSLCSDTLIRHFLRSFSLAPRLDSSRITARRAVHLEWLRSLTAESPLVNASGYELHKFEQSLLSWSGMLSSAKRREELRVCFRLFAPRNSEDESAEEPGWLVEFLLQSVENPGEYITAEQLWRAELGFLRQADYTSEALEELLLRGIGQASDVFSELDRALEDTHPSHVLLSVDEAYAFLRDTARLLEQLGFGIMLPAWWKQPSARLGLRLRVSSEQDQQSFTPGLNLLGANELLNFSWQVSLGEQSLSEDEFRKLVEKNTPLVRIGEQWVELPQKKLSAALCFLEEQQQEKSMRLIDVMRFGFGLEDDRTILPVVGLEAKGWIAKLLHAEAHDIPRLSAPPGFSGELRHYQEEGLSWLAFLSTVGVGGCLADDMGLGKTVQFLALLLAEKRALQSAAPSHEHGPTLLFVPMSILKNWELEAKRFTPELRLFLHHGPARSTGDEFIRVAESCDLVVTTFSLAHRDEDLLSSICWSRIALDEAQNIKNLDAKQTQAIRRITLRRLSLGENGRTCHRIALTGTPIENHLEELWSIFDLLNPGFLGTVAEFRERFVLPIERYRDKRAAETLAKLVRPFVLRRLKTDSRVIDDLPEKVEMEDYTTLTEEQAALYQMVLDGMLPQVDSASGIHRKGLVLSTITKLKQICDHPALYLKDKSPLAGRSDKLSRLEDLLSVILEAGDKVLIFSQYAQLGFLLQPYLEEKFSREVLFLHGALPKRARDDIVERFQKPSGPAIFLLSLKAGGYGLNLTEANQVIHFDQWWNPAVEEQATDRVYRIGQKRNVQVRKLICQGTLEERILSMLKQKRELAREVVGSTKSIVTELSSAELRELLRLSAERPEKD